MWRVPLSAIVATVVGLSSAASAADMRAPMLGKAPVAMAAPPYNWTGWYVGLNTGYGFGGASDPKLSFFDGSGTGFAAYVVAGGNVFPNVIPAGFIVV